MRLRTFAWVVCFTSSLCMAGCGGGGSASPSTTPISINPGSGSPAIADNPVPSVSSFTPTSAVAGAPAQSLLVTGSGFNSSSVVSVNGTALPTTYVSGSSLQATLPAMALATGRVLNLTVTNPAPGGGTSTGSAFSVDNPMPMVASVTPSSVVAGSVGATLDLTGSSFVTSSVVNWNGSPVPTTYVSASEVKATLPASSLTTSSSNMVSVNNPAPGGGASTATNFAVTSPTPVLSGISPTVVPIGVAETITLTGSGFEANSSVLWNGSSRPTTFMSGTSLRVALSTSDLQTSSVGELSVMNPGPGSATSGNSQLTVTTPGFNFIAPQSAVVAISPGSSASIQFGTSANPGVSFVITPSVTGLPAGTTATFTPASFPVGQSVTVTLTAAGNAPISQNQTVTLTGTPSTGALPASSSFLADVTPPGRLLDNRTDFTSTEGTPYAAVYDSVHHQIFVSNVSWNRVDVISSTTHRIIKSIPIPGPQGIDITQDGTTVWVGTVTQQVFGIDTSQLSPTRYLLPQYQGYPWVDNQLIALADGTVLLNFGPGLNSGIEYAAIWNPSTNSLTPPGSPNSGFGRGALLRSGDGTKVYSFTPDSENCHIVVYSVATQSLSALSPQTEVCGLYAVNHDGSQLVVENNGAVGLYDSSLNLLSTLVPNNAAASGYFSGNFVFSQDRTSLFEVANSEITTFSTTTMSVLGTAPSLVQPTMPTMAYPNGPVGVDTTGMLFEIQSFGIGFDDSTYFQNYSSGTAASQSGVALSTFNGPLSGGTHITSYSTFNLTPSVWFDSAPAASISNDGNLTFTSPQSSISGPVNLKYLFPDGSQLFAPKYFSYGVTPQYAVFSGSSPDGGAHSQLIGYGLPLDAGGGTLTIGGRTAAITSTAGPGAPVSGQPFPSSLLEYNFPSGTPGFADIEVQTPSGIGTLPHAIYYAKSVKEYTSPDTLNAMLFDTKRNQLYLAAGDHVDVFSISANQFTTPLNPATLGNTKQFSGLALTPDGSELLVTNLLDGSLAVLNPDSPSSTYAIPINPAYNSPYQGCVVGPLSVVATSDQQAFVTTGSLPVNRCSTLGLLYVVNLQSKAVSQPSANSCLGTFAPPLTDASSLSASTNGDYVVIDGTGGGESSCVYSAQADTYTSIPFVGISMQISGDANVLSNGPRFAYISGNLLGQLALPNALFPDSLGSGNGSGPGVYSQPVFNASGSLYFKPFSNYFEIEDVSHQRLLMRFSLVQTIQNRVVPIAVDSGGRYVFLITGKGLTVVDLGAAPLAIGHLNVQTATQGTQLAIRGSGFDSTMTATIGGVPAATSINDENTLTLTVPATASGPQDIVLTRGDNAKYTLENGLVVQ